jgi:hypothetical protein
LVAAAIMLVVTVTATALEIHRELLDRTVWRRALDDPVRWADALDRFSLTMDSWPVPLPCASLVERLRDAAIRDRARPAVSRVVAAGACLGELRALADRDTSTAIRAAVARTFAFVPGPQRNVVVPRLVAWTRNNDSSAAASIVALGQLGDTSDRVRTAIADAFASGDAAVRREAVEAISRLGSVAELLEMARAAQQDSSSEVRAASIRSLVSLQRAPVVARALLAQLNALGQDTTRVVRDAVRDARRQVGRHP